MHVEHAFLSENKWYEPSVHATVGRAAQTMVGRSEMCRALTRVHGTICFAIEIVVERWVSFKKLIARH